MNSADKIKKNLDYMPKWLSWAVVLTSPFILGYLIGYFLRIIWDENE